MYDDDNRLVEKRTRSARRKGGAWNSGGVWKTSQNWAIAREKRGEAREGVGWVTKHGRHPPRYGRFPHEAFGARTLDDVRQAAFGLVRKKFPRLGFHDIEDAVSDGMLALLEIWQWFPSTQRVLAENDPRQVRDVRGSLRLRAGHKDVHQEAR